MRQSIHAHDLMEHFQLLSDLHLEVERISTAPYTFYFPVTAPNLALLGDIGWTRDERLFAWLELQLSRFERVFFVIGNHEPRLLTLASDFFSYVLILIPSLPARKRI
jgi:hypothetical protein